MRPTYVLAAATLLATQYIIPTAGSHELRITERLWPKLRIDSSEPSGLNRLKADLLVAFLTGTQVSLYLNDSSCNVGETALESY